MGILERTIVDIREEIALMALDRRFTVTEVAQRYGLSRPTVRLWRDRYREQGREGLEDRSHAPRTCPHRMSDELEELIVAERERYRWGSKKILRRLEDAHPLLVLPGRSAVDAVLRRRGLVERPLRRRRAPSSPFRRRYAASEPGELMTIDHKGHFRLGNGRYCYPLTIVDSVSRYVLACSAVTSTRLVEAWPVIVDVFREYGLPRAMQSDNGPPFGTAQGGLSLMSVRLMMLGVLPVFSRPAHPQDNGRHERMHRDLKAETTRPPAANRASQQRSFDAFVERYNADRPHEALDMRRPLHVFKPSPRPYRSPRPPEYPAYFETRKVTSIGQIRLRNRQIFVSSALAGHTIGLQPTDEHLYTVHFYHFVIGKVDTASNTFI